MMTPEQSYIASTPLEHRKRYAQFFTPVKIAEFMCSWIFGGDRKSKILEPAYGLGIFSRTFSGVANLKIDAYEIDKHVYSCALPICPDSVCLKNEDYFKSGWNEKYDGIICNPPYLKFHDYDNAKYISDVNNRLGTKLNGFTNLYTLFLLKSIFQLRENGRLAYIVPSEFLNSDYGVEVKRALLLSKTLKHIIVIDFTKCAFDDALTTACIILCEKSGFGETVKFSTAENIEQLYSSLDDYLEYNTSDLKAEVKWKQYYEEKEKPVFLNLVPFSKFAKVSRGIATGANDYFTFKPSKVYNYNIPSNCLMPCICKAADAQDIFFTDGDYKLLVDFDKAAYLFNGLASPSNSNVMNYIRLGEISRINKKYLTASRNPWYSIENRPPAPIWVSVFSRNGLRFIRNEANIYNLTTFHCVYPHADIDVEVLFSYLITDVAKSIFLENSRQYGNGLIKFEPNDLNKGFVLDLSMLSQNECVFVKEVYALIKRAKEKQKYINVLNDFFSLKYTVGISNLNVFVEKLQSIRDVDGSNLPNDKTIVLSKRVKQLNIYSMLEES